MTTEHIIDIPNLVPPIEEKPTCSICLELIEEESQMYKTNCHHTFHTSCWTTYIKNQNDREREREREITIVNIKCPNCRQICLTEPIIQVREPIRIMYTHVARIDHTAFVCYIGCMGTILCLVGITFLLFAIRR
jgi:Ring finger domain